MLKEQDIQSIINMCKLVHSETDFRRIPMEVEQTLMDQIRLGKFEEIHTIKFDKINTNLGYMAVNPLLQCSFVVVSSIALFSRAAIEGGAVPDDVFDLSDVLILSISYCKTVDETFEIYHLGAVMFAKLVHKHLKTKHSSQVERIMNYMCILFSNQVGLSIHNYIQREKMNLACNLLGFSDRSISDISFYMGFQTQSNFSSVFKKWIKMSLSEYREKNYKEVF